MRCRKMGERCDIAVEVEFEDVNIEPADNRTKAFWRFFREHAGGVPGQKDTWRGASQWTAPLNACSTMTGLQVILRGAPTRSSSNPELLWLYIRAGNGQASAERAGRMRRYSWTIREQMADRTGSGVGPGIGSSL